MSFYRKLVLDNKIGQINLNWPAILAFGVFWSYGFYGTVSFKNPILQIVASLFFLGLFIYFLVLGDKKNLGGYAITLRDITAILSFLLVLILLSWPNLQTPLSGDQFYHTEHSQNIGIAVISALAKVAPALNNFSFLKLLYLFNLGLLLTAALFYSWLRRKTLTIRLAVYTAAFLVLRTVIFFAGGNRDPHPPLRLFPLWLTSAIFSPSGLSFRLATLLGLAVLIWLLYKKFAQKFSPSLAWLFALTAGTLPVLWHVSVIIEHSLWAAFAWTLLALKISDSDPDQATDWFMWFAFLSLFALMRQTAIIGFLPLGLLFLLSEWKGKKTQQLWEFAKTRWKYWLVCLSPLLLALPFFVKSLIVGTPASYVPGEVNFLPAQSNALQRIWYAFESGRVLLAMAHSVFIYGGILLILGFIPAKKSRIPNTIILIIFFLAALSSYYTIRPALWGLGKYASEYAAPFMIAGLYWLTTFLMTKNTAFGKTATAMLLLLVLSANVYFFKNINRLNPPVDETVNAKIPNFIVQSEWSYNYPGALTQAKRQNLDGSLYIAGTSYGIFPEILSDYSVGKILAEYQYYQKLQAQNQPSAELINTTPGIKLVLISDLEKNEKQKLISGLLDLGWRPWQNFYNSSYGSTIVGLIR